MKWLLFFWYGYIDYGYIYYFVDFFGVEDVNVVICILCLGSYNLVKIEFFGVGFMV